jgi:thiol-disulfide isomerase/thioredoxin
VFTSLGLGEALAHSRADGKLLLVDATAPWCGPCRMMDRTTWRDAAVVEWIETHAIAFQLDVDAHGAAAKELSIRAMPTVIVFRDGDEVDRIVGSRAPDALLEWLRALARGVTSLDTKRGELALQPDNAYLRLDYARMLVGAGRLDEATSEYVWVWRHERELAPTYAFELRRLAISHAPARAAFAELRDELTPEDAPSLADLRDWFLLNDLLGDAQRILRWFDDSYASLANHDEVSGLVVQVVGPLLLGAHRWRDARAVYGKRLWRIPVRELVRTWKSGRQRLR